MSLRLWTIVIDAHDPAKLARWWADLLSWKVFYESEDGVEVVITHPDLKHPGLVFVGDINEPKVVKNRLHIDTVPDDQTVEVERALAMGATRVDIGQGDQPWVVLADPEGNEFCILSAREGGM